MLPAELAMRCAAVPLRQYQRLPSHIRDNQLSYGITWRSTSPRRRGRTARRRRAATVLICGIVVAASTAMLPWRSGDPAIRRPGDPVEPLPPGRAYAQQCGCRMRERR